MIDEASLKTLDAQQLRGVVRSLMGEFKESQREEIAFMGRLGLQARVLRLIDRD